ncbi:MAG: hypothetical protein RIC55_02520 [Pirellulaceae bacterium]
MSAGAIRAGRAFVELALRDKLSRGLQSASRRLRAFAGGVQSIGRSMLGLSAAITAPLAAGVKIFTGLGDEIGKAAKRTGVAVESLSELRFAAERSGASFAELETGLRGMSRLILDAERGLSTATDTLKDLGLSLDDFAGKSPEQRFKMLADVIARIEDPNRKAALAMKVFGRAGTALIPMLDAGAAGISQLQAQARELGLTLSKEETDAAEELTDTLANLVDILKITGFKLGAALAEPLGKIVNLLIAGVKGINDFIQNNQRLVQIVAAVGAGLGVAGTALVAIGATISIAAFAMSGLATAASVLASVLGFLLTPVGLVVAAVAAVVVGLVALGAWFLTATKQGQQLVRWISSVFQPVLETVKKAFGGMLDALAAGDFSLAGRILFAALKVEFVRGVNFLKRLWERFKTFFLNLFDQMLLGVLGTLDKLQKELGAQVFDVSGFTGGATGRITARERLRQQTLAAGERDLARAIAELDATIAEAAAKGKTPAFDSSPQDVDVSGVSHAAGESAGFGTFNPEAARRFFGGGGKDPAERSADALEKLLKIDAELLREVKTKDALAFVA